MDAPKISNMRQVFVFGSNQAGRHGAGAALFARKHWGAVYGEGEGEFGNSYALPTKDYDLKVRSLAHIEDSIDNLLRWARLYSESLYLVTPIGCGLAGYTKKQIGEIFKRKALPANLVFTKEWFE